MHIETQLSRRSPFPENAILATHDVVALITSSKKQCYRSVSNQMPKSLETTIKFLTSQLSQIHQQSQLIERDLKFESLIRRLA